MKGTVLQLGKDHVLGTMMGPPVQLVFQVPMGHARPHTRATEHANERTQTQSQSSSKAKVDGLTQLNLNTNGLESLDSARLAKGQMSSHIITTNIYKIG